MCARRAHVVGDEMPPRGHGAHHLLCMRHRREMRAFAHPSILGHPEPAWLGLAWLGLAWVCLGWANLNGTIRARPRNPPNRLRVGIHLTTAPTNEEARMMKSMEDLFYNLLQDVYYAEKQLVKTLPKLAKKSTSPELEKAFMDHRYETEQHVERLERVFEMIGKKARARKCDAILGIIKEGEEVMK